MFFRLSAFAIVAVTAFPACSSSKGDEGNEQNNPGGYVVVGTGGTGALTGSQALAQCSPAVCSTVTSPGPTCSAEVCDGFDNDCNGVVDDLDGGNDGVCDCIRIATLGTPGTWGEGDVFGEWLSARSTNGATALDDQVLTSSLLNQFDIVIVQNVNSNTPDDGSGGIGRPYSQEEIDALAEFVNRRGGLMTMIGFSDSTERTNVNALLNAFGMAYGSEQILQKTNGVTVAVKTWYQHPTTASIAAVGVDNGYEAQSPQNVGTVIAQQGGYDIGRALDVGAGKVLQWGDEWITYNSEWVEHDDYQVQLFWLNIIKWLTPANYCQVVIPPILIN